MKKYVVKIRDLETMKKVEVLGEFYDRKEAEKFLAENKNIVGWHAWMVSVED